MNAKERRAQLRKEDPWNGNVIWIVARTLTVAENIATRMGLMKRQWRYVFSESDLQGRRNPTVMLVEGAYDHPRWSQIEPILALNGAWIWGENDTASTRVTFVWDPSPGQDYQRQQED